MSSTSTPATYNFDPKQGKYTVRGARVLPDELFEVANEVEILDASSNNLRNLPDKLSDLKNLRIAFFSHNSLDAIPRVLASCPKLEMVGFKSCGLRSIDVGAFPPSLRGLILTDNQLTELPEAIGSLTNLQKLMATGNQLSSIPQSILTCQNLELLRLSINKLTTSPDWLFQQLPRLAWYSDAANVFRQGERRRSNEFPEVQWAGLEIYDKIGESTKNVVYCASLRGRQVAVKLFGGGVTTDGSPFDDMNAHLIAGDHPNVIGGIGRIVGNPAGQEGFVMPLISLDYVALGDVPDFTTLTRDTFTGNLALSATAVKRALYDIASAMEYLSRKGIMHGDIYAHNILTNASGKSYLGDFGAASLYEAGNQAGVLRERVDVRGFGYLADDLISHYVPDAPQELCDIRDRCLSLKPDQRPTFAELSHALG